MEKNKYFSTIWGVGSGLWLVCTILESAKESPNLALQILYPICAASQAVVSYLYSPCSSRTNSRFFREKNSTTPATEGYEDEQAKSTATTTLTLESNV